MSNVEFAATSTASSSKLSPPNSSNLASVLLKRPPSNSNNTNNNNNGSGGGAPSAFTAVTNGGTIRKQLHQQCVEVAKSVQEFNQASTGVGKASMRLNNQNSWWLIYCCIFCHWVHFKINFPAGKDCTWTRFWPSNRQQQTVVWEISWVTWTKTAYPIYGLLVRRRFPIVRQTQSYRTVFHLWTVVETLVSMRDGRSSCPKVPSVEATAAATLQSCALNTRQRSEIILQHLVILNAA